MTGKVHDLGSSPRSSPSSYYFAINNHMQMQYQGPSYTFIIYPSTRQLHQIKGPDPRHMVVPVNAPAYSLEKVKRIKVDGPELLGLYLHVGDYNPPRFAIIFFYFIFYLLLIIACLNNLIFS